MVKYEIDIVIIVTFKSCAISVPLKMTQFLSHEFSIKIYDVTLFAIRQKHIV